MRPGNGPDAVAAVPFVLVTGFLGSGKTTLLKRMLGAYASNRRLLVVQNEFANAGIDGVDLRATGISFELMEINRGSVFCVCLLSDFSRSLSAAIERARPDAVILEATGLADPIAVAQLVSAGPLSGLLYLGSVWCVVDNGVFPRLASLTQVERQVRVADTVIINKTDRAPDAVATMTRIRALNPHAEIRTAIQCETALPAFEGLSGERPVARERRHEHAAFESCGRPAVGSAVVRRAEACRRDALLAFVNREAPRLWRFKGHCRTEHGAIMIQSSFGSIEVASLPSYQGPTELVAMGPDVEQRSFEELFDSMVAPAGRTV
jgi:G3E family GTPase